MLLISRVWPQALKLSAGLFLTANVCNLSPVLGQIPGNPDPSSFLQKKTR